MKHLLYEHQENLTELKAEGTVSMRRAQKDHWAQEMELRKDMRSLKVELKEQELANEVVVKNMRLVGAWQDSGGWSRVCEEPLPQREVVGLLCEPSQPWCVSRRLSPLLSWQGGNGVSCRPQCQMYLEALERQHRIREEGFLGQFL